MNYEQPSRTQMTIKSTTAFRNNVKIPKSSYAWFYIKTVSVVSMLSIGGAELTHEEGKIKPQESGREDSHLPIKSSSCTEMQMRITNIKFHQSLHLCPRRLHHCLGTESRLPPLCQPCYLKYAPAFPQI